MAIPPRPSAVLGFCRRRRVVRLLVVERGRALRRRRVEIGLRRRFARTVRRRLGFRRTDRRLATPFRFAGRRRVAGRRLGAARRTLGRVRLRVGRARLRAGRFAFAAALRLRRAGLRFLFAARFFFFRRRAGFTYMIGNALSLLVRASCEIQREPERARRPWSVTRRGGSSSSY